MTHREGVRLAVDVGSVRVGVARSDPSGTMAVPCTTLAAAAGTSAVREIAAEFEAIEIYVGHPVGLSGRRGAAAGAAETFAAELAGLTRVPVRLIDERLSTVSAVRGLRAAGQDAKSARAVVDQAAAVVILEHALAIERAQGIAPGRLVQEVL